MGQETNIGGVVVEIKSGETNISGVVQTIKYGETNIAGVVETISLGEKSFADTPWSEIVAICREAYNASWDEDVELPALPPTWKSGDTHKLKIYDSSDDREAGNENYIEYDVVIIGMWHDAKNGVSKEDGAVGQHICPLTLQIKECLPEKMKPGSDSYFSSDICDELLSLFEADRIDADVAGGLVSTYKQVSMNDGAEPSGDTCYFFLLDKQEVFGGSALGAYDLDCSFQYEYYAQGGTKIKTRLGESETWLLRDWAAVSESGELVSSYKDTAYGISVAFCLGG